MATVLFDLHSHLHFSDFDDTRVEILRRMREQQIGTMVVGTGVETSQSAVSFAQEHKDIVRACIGIHPHEAHEYARSAAAPRDIDQDIVALDSLLTTQPDLVAAVGECGLDYFRLEEYAAPVGQTADALKQIQKQLFVAQIKLAQKFSIPLMIHCRDAYEDVFALLDEHNPVGVAGSVHVHFHFFTASLDILRACLQRGSTVSFPGVVTFVPAVADLLTEVPHDRFMLETDAPYAAPKPYRGKQSNPTMVHEIAQFIAEKKGMRYEDVIKMSQQNVKTFFPKIIV